MRRKQHQDLRTSVHDIAFALTVLLFAGCVAAPLSVPAPAGAETATETAAISLIMVPTDELAGQSLPPDTLIVHNFPGENSSADEADMIPVIAPLSSFDSLPDNAAALIETTSPLSGTVTVLGELQLQQPLAVEEDQVVVLEWPLGGDNTSDLINAYYADPSQIGAGPSDETQISGMRFFPIPTITGGHHQCRNIIQCLCLLCDCCAFTPLDVLRFSSPWDDLVLAPASALTGAEINDETWLVTIDGSAEREITIAPRTQYGALPENSFALVPQSSLPPGVDPAGDIYMSGIDWYDEVPAEIVIKQVRNAPSNVNVEPGTDRLSFDMPIYATDTLSTAIQASPAIHVEVYCPDCDSEDLCSTDPIGCVCTVWGCD